MATSMITKHWGVGVSRQLVRYLAVGVFNTALGFGIIWSLLRTGAPDVPANACGYAVGLLASFLINRRWTFAQDSKPTVSEAVRFVTVCLVAYCANLVILLGGIRLGLGGNPLLHLTAIAAYPLVSFVLARAFVYGPDTKQAVTKAFGPASLLGACVLGACLIFPGMPVTHDVVWQFWIARQMNNGVELYAQINEVNPPLWFWMAQPIEALGTWSGVDPLLLVQLAMIGLAAVSFLLANHLLPELGKGWKLFFLFNSFALGLVLALGNFAQREQIAMLAALPYTLLIIRRAQKSDVRPPIALAVGLIAAVGFALKHYFAVVPVLLELWLLARHRRAYQPVRTETVTVGLAAALYAVAVWRFSPAFLSIQLPMVVAAYDGYSNPPIALVYGPEKIVWAACLVACLLSGYFRSNPTPLATGLWITAGAFFVGYAAQQKGWVYHTLPVTYFAILGLIVAAIDCHRKKTDLKLLLLPTAVIALSYLVPILQGPYHSRFSDDTLNAIGQTPPGSSVFILSSAAQRSWPMIVQNGYIWPSRFMSLWMVPGVVTGAPDDERLIAISHEIRAATVMDLQCNPPATLLVDRVHLNRWLRMKEFDYLSYFTEDAGAKALMDKYELARKTPEFLVYHPRPGATFERPEGCRKIY